MLYIITDDFNSFIVQYQLQYQHELINISAKCCNPDIFGQPEYLLLLQHQYKYSNWVYTNCISVILLMCALQTTKQQRSQSQPVFQVFMKAITLEVLCSASINAFKTPATHSDYQRWSRTHVPKASLKTVCRTCITLYATTLSRENMKWKSEKTSLNKNRQHHNFWEKYQCKIIIISFFLLKWLKMISLTSSPMF